MKTIYVTLDSEGFVNGWGSTRGQESDVELTLEENHAFFSDPFSYSIQDGQPVFSQEKKDSRVKEREEVRNRPTVSQRLEDNEFSHSGIMMELAVKDAKIRKQQEEIERQQQIIEQFQQTSTSNEAVTAEIILKLSAQEVI
ncbi:hypothetical protein 031MP004_29 [Bacillus phage 031MP004]|nr:hypothetical protein 031MP004_29 [Bacillus phage 031MP004]